MGEIIDFEEALKKLSDDDWGKIIKYAANNINSHSVSKNDIISRLVECYEELLAELKIEKYNTFSFIDYEDPRTILVDDKEIDMDDVFTRENEDARGLLYEIDAIMGDLVCDYPGNTQVKVQKMLEKKLTKYKGE